MPKSWVLLADHSRTRVVAGLALGRPFEIARFDARGAVVSPPDPGVPRLVPPPVPRDAPDAPLVARTIDYLEHARQLGAVERLVVVAPSPILAALRAGLGRELRRAVVLEVDDDWGSMPPEEVARRLALQRASDGAAPV
jgi:hypothetical protein